MKRFVWFAVAAFAGWALSAPAAVAQERWAAIAWSSNPAKPDGWGAESYKDTGEGAATSARAICVANMKERGYSGTCDNVENSNGWVAGIACHVPGGSMWQGLGTGSTPAEAIQGALDKVAGAPPGLCGTTVIRSGSHRWRDFYSTSWTVKLSCGAEVSAPSKLKGFTALTRALISCRRQSLSGVRVVTASYAGMGTTAERVEPTAPGPAEATGRKTK